MILYDPDMRFSLPEFGIQIPVFDSRASRAFAALRDHPVLGKQLERWHRTPACAPPGREDLERVHDADYVARLFSADLEKEIINTFELVDVHGRYYRYAPDKATLPLTDLFQRILNRVSGTIECTEIALETGFCFYFGGGMHHAMAGFGNGFCMLNDIVIAVRKLQAAGRIRTAWIIDVDAHKGDGTAALTQGDNSIVTLSIHMAEGWPLDGDPINADGSPNPSFIPGDIDLPVPKDASSQYLPMLTDGLAALSSYPHPDLAVVVSGADPYEHDELPSTRTLRLTLAQLDERDHAVYRFLTERRIPAAYLMAGGYGHRSWEVYSQFLEWVLMERFGTETN